ncbi:MAG: D-alanyl-D-alanine carboxypeptidase [candidate division Zixibacteria bacterium]|nr:D-alanyl-D-alanine carboxypeptidase [candidate division Zixibacteria bacterium]
MGMRTYGFFGKTGFLLGVILFFFAATVCFLEPTNDHTEATLNTGYHFDFDQVSKGPHLNLKSAILVNYDNGEVLYARNADRVRPVASISKLVTAMVVLDKGVDLSRTEIIKRDDARRSSRSRLRVGSKLSLHDLLHAALISSDNRAARALARATCGSIDAFVREMNNKAEQMGLEHTVFHEPTGLDTRNVSTAHEVARILHHAYEYDTIARITSLKTHRVRLLNKKNSYVKMSNTNRLLWSRYRVLVGKTGYIRAADYCLTALVRNSKGERLTLVTLGVPGDKLRFKESRRLLDWGFRKVS